MKPRSGRYISCELLPVSKFLLSIVRFTSDDAMSRDHVTKKPAAAGE